MKIRRLLYNPYSEYIIAILLGFGMATLFRKICKERKCIIYKAAKHSDEKVYKFNNKCYINKSHAVTCDSTKQILEYA